MSEVKKAKWYQLNLTHHFNVRFESALTCKLTLFIRDHLICFLRHLIGLNLKWKNECYNLSSKSIIFIHQHAANTKISPRFNFILVMEMGSWSIILVPRGEMHSILPIFPDMWSQEGMYAARTCSKYCQRQYHSFCNFSMLAINIER